MNMFSPRTSIHQIFNIRDLNISVRSNKQNSLGLFNEDSFTFIQASKLVGLYGTCKNVKIVKIKNIKLIMQSHFDRWANNFTVISLPFTHTGSLLYVHKALISPRKDCSHICSLSQQTTVQNTRNLTIIQVEEDWPVCILAQ